jgi:hypothetical protein
VISSPHSVKWSISDLIVALPRVDVDKTQVEQIMQQAGEWSSLAMPLVYRKESTIAFGGVDPCIY